MEGIKIAALLICCFLLKASLSAPVPTNDERMQMLEERVEELTERLELLKEESLHHTKRQASSSGTILNENRKLRLLLASYVIGRHTVAGCMHLLYIDI